MTENQTIVLPQFIQDILALAEGNNLVTDQSKDPVADGDKIIGEMTPFERACFVFSREGANQAKKKVEEGASIENDSALFLLKKAKMADEMMWISIREKMADLGPQKIALRDGWKIVEITETEDDEECDCPLCQMERAILGGEISVIGIGIGRRQ
jgi:hypothetical protein